ncbi:unannotated protein [freshwater metagenome]|uniref:UDP-MurNAc-pentapeptide synthetase n=1 Tax=freshwater metagenome TaxID=449393 RepID=A0A6J7DSE6_9ZZZZ|nr:UDP-N-acetylmuramoyl-tripeptide--D-alanyl-D-alanine ligase [Actinomycetota bacterium]
MRSWDAQRIAHEAGAELVSGAGPIGPQRVVIDSREVASGDLFVGLAGERDDGGRFAAAALATGAWGVLVAPEHRDVEGPGVVLVADDPLAALQRLATAWRHELGCRVIGITGSTGKTTTKDILRAMLAGSLRTVATAGNRNTELGVPLTILEASEHTEVLVLEMGMRGAGQITELAAIAQPDVGIVVSVGPVHLELLGSVEAIAAAKAELLHALPADGVGIVPFADPLLAPHLAGVPGLVTFGPGGDVERLPPGLDIPLPSSHLRRNALAALAAARAVGVEPEGRIEVELSRLRGERIDVGGGVTVIDDCYNANPMSMQAALDDLAGTASGRSVAVLGDMLELGPDERRFHAELGVHARDAGVGLLVTVGPLAAHAGPAFGGPVRATQTAAEAAALIPELVEPGDVVLVKASRGVGLEVIAHALAERPEASDG